MNIEQNKMQDIEHFFSKDCSIDTPKKLNRADKVISEEIIKNIAERGITSEELETLNMPVFKYNTQITVHGIFNMSAERLGMYKVFILNQNQSLGIKYNAIDREKKQRIYSAISKFGFYTRKDSSHWKAELISKELKTKEELHAQLEEYKNLALKIPSNKFVGNTQIFAFKHPWFGTIHAAIYISILAVREEHQWEIIEAITGKTKEQVLQRESELKAESEALAEKNHLEYETKDKERKDKITATISLLKDAGYTERVIKDIEGIFYKVDYNGNIEAIKIYKVAGKQKLRYNDQKIENLTDTPEFRSYNEKMYSYSMKLWTKEQPVKIEVKKEIKPIAAPAQINGKIELVTYSEKAIALFGDTKQIKEQLKVIGARFNPYLNYNGTKAAGWILPASKREIALTLI